MIRSIFGIGNPGKEYENTYHNIGKVFSEFIQSRQKIHESGAMSEVKIFQSDLFMNESGLFVAKKLKNTNLKIEEVAIAHDDSDLSLGKFKIDFDAGSAGHNGIESIIQNLGTKKFWRIRIGIRPEKEEKRMKAEAFVLKSIKKNEMNVFQSVFLEIEKALTEKVVNRA